MGKRRGSSFFGLGKLFSALYKVILIDLYKGYLVLASPPRRKKLWHQISHFLGIMYQRIVKEKVPREAASLAYTTILGFIPFITFIVMLAPDLPFLNLKERIASVVENFIPGSAPVMDLINELIQRRMGLNIMVFVILLVSSYLLFNNIRSTFDRILSTHAPQSQDIITQFIKFFGTLVFGLLVIVLLFSSSSLPIISHVLRSPLFTWLSYILPFVVQFAALLFLYLLLPTAKIKRASLIRGTFWTTVIWVLVKSGFDSYILNLTSYQAVYGVLAALPIFLFWIYVNWMIILGGVVLVSVIDNKDNEEIIQKVPQQVVRLSLEMYSDGKLNESLKSYISKQDIKDLVELIDKEGSDE